MRTMNVAELKGAGVAAPLPRWLDTAIARYRPPPQVGDLKSFAAELQRYLNGASVTITSGAAGAWARVPGHAPLAWETRAKRRTFSHRKPVFHEETTALLLSFLIGKFRPDTFFDIGASSGYFARVAASHVTDAPTVHAFEMRPDYFAEMRRNLEHDGLRDRVVLHHTCLSDQHVGERDFWYARMKLFEYEPELHEYQEAWWRRLKFFLRGRKDRGLVKARGVVTSIDRFVADHGVVPALVKIDVDGYEVWDGWVIAALVLWLVMGALGSRTGKIYDATRDRARALVQEGSDAPNAELRAMVQDRRGLWFHVAGIVTVLLLLVDMVWKPGA